MSRPVAGGTTLKKKLYIFNSVRHKLQTLFRTECEHHTHLFLPLLPPLSSQSLPFIEFEYQRLCGHKDTEVQKDKTQTTYFIFLYALLLDLLHPNIFVFMVSVFNFQHTRINHYSSYRPALTTQPPSLILCWQNELDLSTYELHKTCEVCCGIWHHDLSRGSFKFCKL